MMNQEFNFGFLEEPILELANKIKPRKTILMALTLLSLPDFGRRLYKESLKDKSIFEKLSPQNQKLIQFFIELRHSEKISSYCVTHCYLKILEMYPELNPTNQELDKLSSEAEQLFPLSEEKSNPEANFPLNSFSKTQNVIYKKQERYLIISRLLNNKFGRLPHEIIGYLDLLNEDQLLIFLDKIFSIETIEDLKECLEKILKSDFCF